MLLDAGANQAMQVPGVALPALFYASGLMAVPPNHPGVLPVLKLLLENCAVVELDRAGCLDPEDSSVLLGETPLVNAIKAQNVGAAIALVKAGANPNAVDAEGFAALHHAAALLQHDVVAALIAAGADLTVIDPTFGYTALHIAVTKQSPELVALLAGSQGSSDDEPGGDSNHAAGQMTAASLANRQIPTNPAILSSFVALASQPDPGEPPEAQSATQACAIPTVTLGELSPELFTTRYHATMQPLLIDARGELADVLANWSVPELLGRFGGLHISTGEIPYGDDFGNFNNAADGETLQQFYRRWVGSRGVRPWIAFDDTAVQSHPGLGAAAGALRPFFAALCDGAGTEDVSHAAGIQLSFGGNGSGAPPHSHSTAWNLLVAGAKRWWLIPPGHKLEGAHSDITDSVSRKEHVTEWLNARSHDLDAPTVECEQLPGQYLFLPQGWAHATLNTDPAGTIALAQEFCACIGSCCGPTCSLAPSFGVVDSAVLEFRRVQDLLRSAAHAEAEAVHK